MKNDNFEGGNNVEKDTFEGATTTLDKHDVKNTN